MCTRTEGNARQGWTRWLGRRSVRGEARGEVLLTSIDRDGGRSGYDLALTRAVADAVNVPVIASGGAGSAQHLVDAFTEGQAEAALVAGMVDYGTTTVGALKRALRQAGLDVRGGLS